MEHPYIERKSEICSGKAVVKGSRIQVSQIVVMYLDHRMSIDEIIVQYPSLKPAQIYDALSWYYENQAEIDQQIVDELTQIRRYKKRYPSKLEGALEIEIN